MNTTISRVLLLALAFFVCQAPRAQALKPGDYYNRAYGQLQISKANDLGIQNFSLFAEGSNGHSCTLAGTIKNHLSIDTADQCFINFDQTKDSAIKVFVDQRQYPKAAAECRQNCGMRAYFEGTYKPRPNDCRPDAIQKIRNRFLNSYKSKRYQEALQTLKASQLCVEWIHWLTQDQIANDLAITHFHLGQNQACLDLLKPFVSAAEKPINTNVADQDDDGVWQYIGVQPAFYADGAVLLQSVRTNLRLCGHKFPIAKKQ